MSDLAMQLVAAAGGAAAVVLLILGGLWVFAREAILRRLQVHLDRQKSVFEYALARDAVLVDAHAREAFESALEVWTALGDATQHVERLWKVISETNVIAAAEALARARAVINRYTALVTEEERRPLLTSMDRMEEFLDIKTMLNLMLQRGVSAIDQKGLIEQNRRLRDELLAAIEESRRGLERRTRPPSVRG